MAAINNPPFSSSMCHIRRILPDKNGEPAIPSNGRQSLILLDTYVKFGRNHDLCDVVLTSTFSSSNMISRDHAEINGIKSASGRIERYTITDHSLNGTYINDRRCRGKTAMPIKEGDIIKFGHMNGASIKDGQDAPQANAEFAFVVERADPNIQYMGFKEGRRTKAIVCRGEMDVCTETEGHFRNRNAAHAAAAAAAAQAAAQAAAAAAPQLSIPSTVAAVVSQAAASQAVSQAAAAAQLNLFQGMQGLTPQLAAQLYNAYPLNNLFATGAWSNLPVVGGFKPPNVFTPIPSTSASILQSSLLRAANPLMNTLLTPVTAAAMAAVSTPGLVSNTPEILATTATPNAAVLAHTKLQSDDIKDIRPIVKNETAMKKEVMSPQLVSSPPMECDSSVPSPPKASVVVKQPLISPKPKEEDRSDAESPPLRRTAAPAPWDSTPSPRPRDTPDRDNVKDSREREPEQKKTSSAAPVTKHRKTNEIARLLEDITETSFVNQMRRASTSRRPTEEEMLEKSAKREKKKKEKEKAKKEQIEKEKKEKPSSATPVGRPPIRRLKQLSDESSVSSDSDSDESSSPVKKEPPKRKRHSSISSEGSVSNDSDDSSKPKKVKKAVVKITKTPKRVEKKAEKKVEHRGRKPKAAPKPVPQSSSEEEEEEEDEGAESEMVTTHDSMSTCGLKSQCTRPQSQHINWICCDDCDEWYHNICILGQEEDPNTKHFYCGCKKREQKNKKKIKK